MFWYSGKTTLAYNECSIRVNYKVLVFPLHDSRYAGIQFCHVHIFISVWLQMFLLRLRLVYVWPLMLYSEYVIHRAGRIITSLDIMSDQSQS